VKSIKAPSLLFGLHIFAMVFGLVGIVVMIPHPELWSGNPLTARAFSFSMQHGGATHILFGAATMLAFGLYALGWRRTLVFFVIGTALPAAAELRGTATGWPFGGYAYTDFLGFKLGGRVPYSVPLSWFYMGFASYLLASAIVGRRQLRWRPLWAVLLGAWLLTAWDLVLDPAMASPKIATQYGLSFWTWHETGPYFGMPLRNLVGWFGTGLAFIALSRFPFRDDPEPRRMPVWLPFGVYVANVLWAMALSLSVGLWPTAVAAALFSLAPASLVWRGRSGARPGAGKTVPADPVIGASLAGRVRRA